MKRLIFLFLWICSLCVLGACNGKESFEEIEGKTAITDAFGNTTYLNKRARVISGYASFAECWLLSGGTLVGITEDAITEHELPVEDAEIIGTVKHVDLEKVVALAPDYLMLSADLTAHLELQKSLDAMGIRYGYFRVDVFSDYKALMEQFCEVNERKDLFEQNVTKVEQEIHGIMERIPKTDKTVLLVRAFSTGMKAKRDDNLAGQILRDFGLTNIADGESNMLEDLSMEHIVKSDPDYIFATTMGNEEGAIQYLKEHAENNPAWRELSSVKQGNYHLLPKKLFHYKPNNRWSESYEYLAELIWPESFCEQ